MIIEILYFDDCPNHAGLEAHLRDLMRSADTTCDIRHVQIADADAAVRQRFLGSPTVRIDGHDVDPGADQRNDFGLKCRLYQTSAGLTGVPDDAWILTALRRAAQRRRGRSRGAR